MKHIKTFEKYSDYTGIEHYRYLDLEILDNGNLKIILNDDGKKEVEEEGIDENKFDDYFEDIRTNSEYKYFNDLGDAGLGMSEAPCITLGYFYDDDGSLTDDENSYLYWYPNYIMKNFTEELKEKGYVIFTNLKPRSEEEIKDIIFKKNIQKFNL